MREGEDYLLKGDIDRLGLLKDDRIEHSEELPDVGLFWDSVVSPITVTFWRRACERRTGHRNPIFNPKLGITLQIMVVDSMHAFSFGPVRTYCMHAVWELILRNAFGLDCANQLELIEMSVAFFESYLLNWYKTHGDQTLTQFQDFMATMIGTNTQRCLKAKAAELNGLLLRRVTCIAEYGNVLERKDIWLGCAESLANMFRIFTLPEYIMPLHVYQDSKWAICR